jgi:hypothetical protein
MMYRQIWWLSAGAIGGMLGARLMARPAGRRWIKSLLRRAFAVKDALDSELALTREDFSDLVAEAREEYRQSLDPEAAPAASDQRTNN